jgi:2-polyprenyl-6-methoxyphenol hydroxylase-like FAD-dependent oxidoreductase
VYLNQTPSEIPMFNDTHAEEEESFMKHTGHHRHAVIIGASMAGMLSATIAANHFEQVTIIERDALPTEPEFRSGAPQARHLHALLRRGQLGIEHLFPGFTQTLLEHGAQQLDYCQDIALNVGGRWLPRFNGGIDFLAASRYLIDWVLRQALLQQPNITWRTGQEAIALRAIGKHIGEVTVRHRAARQDEHSPTDDIEADLFIDASGRTSKTPVWLKVLGYRAPAETIIDAHVGYASCWMQLPANPIRRTWKALYMMPHPPSVLVGGVIAPIEGEDCYAVALIGYGDHIPPTDSAGFLLFAQRLPFPDIAEALDDATITTPIYGYRTTRNQFRHFERLDQMPDNLVVLGDAVAAFNPIYAQGMTAASMSADLLAQTLSRPAGESAFGVHFQRELAKRLAVPWQLSTAADLTVPGMEGPKPSAMTIIMNRYLERVFSILPVSRQAHLTFIKVINLLAPPTALLAPRIVLRTVFTDRG